MFTSMFDRLMVWDAAFANDRSRYINVSTGDFCPIWTDDFHTIDPNSWGYEIQRGGFGTGSFDWTTDGM